MDKYMSESLDKHITGNYGEDQVKSDDWDYADHYFIDEGYEDFLGEFMLDLKKEFLQGKSEDLLEGYEVDCEFEKFCKEQYQIYLDEIRSQNG